MTNQIHFKRENDIELIESFNDELVGYIKYDGSTYNAIITKSNTDYFIEIDGRFDIDIETFTISFFTDNIRLKLLISITTNSVNTDAIDKKSVLVSKEQIYEMTDMAFDKNAMYIFRSYYKLESSNFLHTTFERSRYIELNVNKHPITLSYTNRYLIIESKEPMLCDVHLEICYNTMLAIGFITGKFIQTEVYNFYENENTEGGLFQYCQLRNSFSSIYCALTTNPYGYKHLISEALADDLYNNKVLKPFDPV